MFLPIAVSRERRGTQHIRHKHPLALIAGSDTPQACTAFGDARRRLMVRSCTAAARSTCNTAQKQLAYVQCWLGFLRLSATPLSPKPNEAPNEAEKTAQSM